ncbi:hypothetical protein [Anaeromicropila herbilytica]|uniref:AAA domain-containing protein n=1 Tax=Anaeromicropila herbilytica TaxID=2785025 RepID=A0A7R7EKG8_9FIRM|nr:hypothetical protein [Anaeromicropila herbilytica]BCN30241.1 hypothetical protein bsdtb5_15360 [Anaeromicropila herbilytica]
MKTAFFSNVSGKNGVTSNIACISIMCAMEYQLRSMIIENHSNLNSIENAFVRYHEHYLVNEDYYYFNHIGIEAVIKKLHSEKEDDNMIESASKKFLNHYIYYLPQSHTMNKEVLEFQLNEVISRLLEKAEQCSDITFVDMEGKVNLTSRAILEEADLVVVNLSQDIRIIRHFFEHYQALIPKAIFLISKYDSRSKYNVKNIMRKYHISKENIAVIPYNVEYKDAISEGKVIEFIARNYNCKEEDDNYTFIREVRHATDILYQKSRNYQKEVLSV